MKSCYKEIKIGNLKAIVLKSSSNSEITVLPQFGANLLRFIVNDVPIIDYSYDVLQNRGFTGTPLLFPTPNRVLNAETIYNGKAIKQIKNGKERVCHGLIYDEPFEVCEIYCGEEKSFIDLSLNIDSYTSFFNSFPFECVLHVIYTLCDDYLQIEYTLENLSENEFQYGFGIHPYFCYGKDAKVTLPAKKFLELKNEYPTGRLKLAEKRFQGISTVGTDIETLAIDDDFVCSGTTATIIDLQKNIKIETSDDFRHFVVYKNIGDNFICVEPQTCSINAHRLNADGFRYANVINILPNQIKRGFVKVFVNQN